MKATAGLCRLFMALAFGTLLLWSNPALPAAASTRSTQHASGITSHSLIDLGGHWLVASDGGIFGFGNTSYYGSMGGHPLNRPIVGMAPTPDGGGYWLVASDGGIFAFGDAGFYGSMGGHRTSTARSWAWRPPPTAAATGWSPPTAGSSASATPASTAPWAAATSTARSWAWRPPPTAAATGWSPPTAASSASATPGSTAPWAASRSTARSWAWRRPRRRGYWLVASDGGIFNFGDAGSTARWAARPLNNPIVGMASHRQDGGGYWLVSVRRRHLQLRRCWVLRLHGGTPAQQSHRRHGICAPGPWILCIRQLLLQLRERTHLGKLLRNTGPGFTRLLGRLPLSRAGSSSFSAGPLRGTSMTQEPSLITVSSTLSVLRYSTSSTGFECPLTQHSPTNTNCANPLRMVNLAGSRLVTRSCPCCRKVLF